MNELHTLAADMRRKYLEASRDPSLGLTAPILESWLRTVEPMADDRDRLAAECKALSDQCQDVRAQRDKAQAELSAARALATELCMQHCGKAYYGPCISTDCPRRTAPSAGGD